MRGLDLSRRAAEICRPADYFLNEPTAYLGQLRKSRQLGARKSAVQPIGMSSRKQTSIERGF